MRSGFPGCGSSAWARRSARRGSRCSWSCSSCGLWVLLTLGRRWTTRIIVLPGAPLVASGPYRLSSSHPNYLVVVAEIAVLPLCFGLPWYALAFSAANAVVLTIRIRAETAALAGATPWRPIADGDSRKPVTAATWLGFGAMCVGMFMAILDVQIVATSLPDHPDRPRRLPPTR